MILAPDRPLGILLMIFATSTAAAVEVDHLEIDAEERRYVIDMSFRVAAAPSTVIALLTDFGYPDRLNPDVPPEAPMR